jgi:hypothetical protein
VSPGFALLPRDRRRRVSGLGLGEVVDQAMGASGMRRTVSEGDVVRDLEGLAGQEVDVGRGVHTEAGGASEVLTPPPTAEGEHGVGKGGLAKARWRWLGRIFGGRPS